MSTTDSTESDRLKVAVYKMVAHPGLSVKDAMTIAKFTDDEIEDKNMQRKVLRRLPGKGKRGMIQQMSENAEEGSIIHSIDIENQNNSDMSPITDNSTTSLLNSDSKQNFFEGAMAGGERLIPEHQLKNILNFDETCLSLDGSTLKRGGRPVACRTDPRLPQVGKTTSKSSQTVTMITGSNAYGEVLPPHFQFMT